MTKYFIHGKAAVKRLNKWILGTDSTYNVTFFYCQALTDQLKDN